MTIDDLIEVFNREAKLPSIRKADIAGIRSVVEALRDEFVMMGLRDFSSDFDIKKSLAWFTEILGSDGEKVADTVAQAVEPLEVREVTGASPVRTATDFAAHLARQRTFSERTFGPGERLEGVSDHIRKELAEVAKATPGEERQAEWIDVVMLALDGAWRSGMSPEQIIQGLRDKLEKNERRTWPDWRTADPNRAIEHNRATNPAPAVCEWKRGKEGWLFIGCRPQFGLNPLFYKPEGACEFCSAPIKFTEAK